MSTSFIATLKQNGFLPQSGLEQAGSPYSQSHDIGPRISLATDPPNGFIPLPGDRGFVVGTLHHRHGPSDPVVRLSDEELNKIWNSKGQHLIERYWGHYVAVIHAEDALYVLRDPSGMLPCYFVASRGVVTLGSEPTALARSGNLRAGIDITGLARALLHAGLPEQNTALFGVQELLPGMCLHIEESKLSTSVRWNPWDFVPEEAVETVEEQAERLRRVTRLCVNGWANQFERPLLSISGGLDSSIVGACLSEAGREFSCITLLTDDSLGNEQTFSRTFAQHAGRRLFEERYALEDINLDRSSVGHMARPFGRMDANAYDAVVVRVARQSGAGAIFTGNGGDNVFYMSRSARPLADRYLAEGVSSGLFGTVRDIQKLTGASVAQVIGHGFRAWRKASKPYLWRAETEFLSRALTESAELSMFHHPWFDLPRKRYPPGKAAHIAMLVRMHYSLSAYSSRGGVPVVHPLASQPILECCVQIPSWQQCDQGIDRSVARRAFARALPPALISRKVKGSPQGFSFQIFANFRDQMCDRLMDGFLLRNGILDRSSIEMAFANGDRLNENQITRLLMLVDAEAWVRNWTSAASSDKRAERRSVG